MTLLRFALELTSRALRSLYHERTEAKINNWYREVDAALTMAERQYMPVNRAFP